MHDSLQIKLAGKRWEFYTILENLVAPEDEERMKSNMKTLSLLLWVTQFGLSVLFPLCFFLLLSVWLQRKYQLGMWIVILFGILGLLTSISTAKSCIRSLVKDADEASDSKKPPIAFNDHE